LNLFQKAKIKRLVHGTSLVLRLTFKLSQRGQEDAIRVASLVAHLMNFARDELV